MANNLLPVDWKPAVKTSPVFNYPYARTREALDALARNGEPDPYHGHKLRYVNPATGEFAMPTIGTFIQLLPAGLRASPTARPTAPSMSASRARARPGSATRCFRWGPHDIFVVPGWMPHTPSRRSEAVLFSFSDRPVQEKLGLWREVRGNA